MLNHFASSSSTEVAEMSRENKAAPVSSRHTTALLDLMIECFQVILEFLRRYRGRDPEAFDRARDREGLPVLPEHWPGIDRDLRQPQVERPSEAVRVVPNVMNPVRATRFYAVAVGRRPGVYESWREAAEQVIGYGGNIH